MRARWLIAIMAGALIQLMPLCGLPAYETFFDHNIWKGAHGTVEPVLAGRCVPDFTYYDSLSWQRGGWYNVPDDADNCWAILINWPILLISWNWLPYRFPEFTGGGADGTLLLEMSVWNKHATIPRELTRWYVYFVEGFNAIIGGANIGIKFDPKVYARGGGTSNVLNLDTYSSFNVFRRENEWFAFWNAHFNCYPGSIYRNHRFAMNTIGLLGRPSMSVCCCCGALSGADRMLAFENGLPSGPPQQCSENPQPGSSKEKGSGKASYPPVWFRVPLALFLGIGSNGVLAWGLV